MFFNKEKNQENKTGNAVEYIIVGLGNPDRKYENTRHNAGFMAIDKIAGTLNVPVDRVKFKALVGTAEIAGHKCLLMKPTTYMNNSGEAVVAAMNFYKVPPQQIIVMFDDISLEPSKLRIRLKGSHGGHNGIKSIIALTGHDDFPRIKFGVGKKPHPDYDLADWVLSSFSKDELAKMQEGYVHVMDIITDIVNGNPQEAMNKFNS